MKSPRRHLRRFLDIARTGGLSSAVLAVVRKPVRVLNRQPLREVARVGGDLEQVAQTLAGLDARVAANEAIDLPARVARLEADAERLQRLQHEFDRRAARLEADSVRVDQAWEALELHARSIVSLAELHAASGSAATGSVPPGVELISVIMPTCNRADDLRIAIRSVQAQSWPHWELVVVDDGSTDSTQALLAGLAAEDPRIRWFGQPRQGHAVARNVAVGHARGGIVTYLDDDNEYYPDYLAAVAWAYAGDPQLEMAYAAQLWMGSRAASMVTFDRYSWDGLRDMNVSLDTNAVSHRMSLRRRAGGFDERLLRHADLDLVLRYAAGTTPRRIPVLAVRYRWDATPRVSNTMSSAAALHRIREKHAKPEGQGLRVLFLTYDYPQLSESYIHAEIRWLLTRGAEIEAYSQEEPVSRGRAIVPVHYAGLAQIVERFKPDVIHVHWLSLARQYAPELSRFGVPVTVKGHGFDHREELVSALMAEPWISRLYLFGNLPQPGLRLEAKLRTCACAVDTSRYYPVYAKDRRLVLRAGACLPTKDLEMFIEVAALCPECRFLLALSTNQSGRDTEQRLRLRNEELGRPVEILADVQYEPMADLMRQAGIYLHTFGFTQPFGQPVSVAEAMACGTIPLLRRADSTRAYAGDAALYYGTADEAAGLLRRMLTWDDRQWDAAQLACIDMAYTRHADTHVLEPMLQDWLALRSAAPAVG